MNKYQYEWIETEIGEVINDIGDGGTPNRNKSENFGGNIPWVVVQDIKWNIFNTKENLSDLGLKSSSTKLWSKGTVIISTGGTIGKVGIAKTPLCTKQGIHGIVCNEKYILPEYLAYFLISKKNKLNALSQGSTIKEIRAKSLSSIKIKLPSLYEQKKIAQKLTSIDQVSQKIHNKISKLNILKKSFQSNFIPNKTNQNSFNYRKYSLNSFCERVIRNNSDNISDVLTISSTKGWIDQKQKWARNMAGKSIEKYILLKRGEFSYNRGNSKTYPQGCVFRLDKWEQALVPNVYHSFRINNEIVDSDYLQIFFSSGGLNADLRKVITSSVRGNGLLNITANTFFQQTIILPSLSDQKNIAQKLLNLNSQIDSLKNKLYKIEYFKKSISNDLLSGLKRVNI